MEMVGNGKSELSLILLPNKDIAHTITRSL
jgi:hypothetical protein